MRLLILLLMLTSMGCGASRSGYSESADRFEPILVSPALDAVNARLAQGHFVIATNDGQELGTVHHVQVGTDWTVYENAAGVRGRMPTREVASITSVRRSAAGRGIALGAAPSLVVATLGGVLLVTALVDPNGTSEATGIVGAGVGMLGLTVAAVGAVAGGTLGTVVAPRRSTVVYMGPVSRYLPEPR